MKSFSFFCVCVCVCVCVCGGGGGVGGQLQCIYYLVLYTDHKAPRVFRRFKRRSCFYLHLNKRLSKQS